MQEESQGDTRLFPLREYSSQIGVNFNNIQLLDRALTHRSYLNEHPEALEDNERLEFLGDAVLDFLVGAWLYNQFPEKAEGELTRLRSALVRTEQLALFAMDIDLGSVIHLGRGEEENGGRVRNAILCGAFEALVGALYIDSGMVEVNRFIEPLLAPAAENIIKKRSHKDPKSVLQEWVQSQGFPPPNYETISMNGPEHKKIFEVEVQIADKPVSAGTGKSKQQAEKEAAINAITKLGLSR